MDPTWAIAISIFATLLGAGISWLVAFVKDRNAAREAPPQHISQLIVDKLAPEIASGLLTKWKSLLAEVEAGLKKEKNKDGRTPLSVLREAVLRLTHDHTHGTVTEENWERVLKSYINGKSSEPVSSAAAETSEERKQGEAEAK
jgi:hypothetical protein